jgi:hypothetical protein
MNSRAFKQQFRAHGQRESQRDSGTFATGQVRELATSHVGQIHKLAQAADAQAVQLARELPGGAVFLSPRRRLRVTS